MYSRFIISSFRQLSKYNIRENQMQVHCALRIGEMTTGTFDQISSLPVGPIKRGKQATDSDYQRMNGDNGNGVWEIWRLRFG
jgi:hypothetical protein